MPEQETLERAEQDAQEGKAPSTQAGEFVREEVEHVRRGKHGARSTKQAIVIGLSKARRAGVKLPPPKRSTSSARTCRKAAQEPAAGKHPHNPAARRSRATEGALKREKRGAGSRLALSRQARHARANRPPKALSAAAKDCARIHARRRNP